MVQTEGQLNFHSVIFVEQLKQICMKCSKHTHSANFWHCVECFRRFSFIDLYLVPCESLVHNLHFFLCLFLAGNNSAEWFLEVIFLFKITHIFCWTIDDKPLSDLFSINGVVRFCTNSHPKSNEFTFCGSSFLFKAKIVDTFMQLLSRIYENAAIFHLLLFTLQL